MKFADIQHLRKQAEKDINRAMTWKQQSYLCVQAEH